MAEISSIDASVRLLLVGECAEHFSPTRVAGYTCVNCPAEMASVAKAVRSQRDSDWVVIAPVALFNVDGACEIFSSLRKSVAILGLGEGTEQNASFTFYDALLPVAAMDVSAVTLSALAELARTRRQLKKMEADLEQQVRMMDQVSMAIIGTDLSGNIKAWNNRAETMFGFESDECLGQPLSAVFQKGRSSDFNMHSLLEPLLIHDRHQFETDIRRRNGEHLPIQVSLSLEKNNHGDIIGIICCCRDISLRRRVEGERREAFQRMTFFIESMPLGFIEWDINGDILAWNQSSEQIFGYSQREAIGQSFSMLIEKTFVENARGIFNQMRERKGGVQSRNNNVTRDGRVITCDWTNSALIDEKGNVVGFASIVSDVTEQIQIEEELKASRESAFAANRSKDEFLAVMSHEVRTPMNSIIGFADLLMESLEDDEQGELVNIIKANAFNLLELINNVLNYSRLEAGEVNLMQQETDLIALFHEIEEVTQAEAKEKGLTFAVEFMPETPHQVMADYSELRQVLLNLTANALKFTQRGGVVITISAKPLPGVDPWSWELLFAVKDTGIGIAEADQGKLFQSFTQLDSSSTRRFGGTGLGLAICRRIVELWSGKIWAESNVGEGSAFFFTLPTTECQREGHRRTSDVPYEEIEDHRFAEIFPLQILLVSNTNATVEVVEKIMASLGYEIGIQQDGIEAISHMQDTAYDIILIDDDLSDFSSAEMLEIIKTGQAGTQNESAHLIALIEKGPQNKDSSPSVSSQVEVVNKPIIARNIRMALRRIAIGRDVAKSKH